MQLDEFQLKAIKDIVNNDYIFLTGKAGTGKSTVIKEAISVLKKKRLNVAVLGTTGISANNIGGQTIHSFFSLPIADITTFDKCFYLKKEKRYVFNKTDVVIIDEASMLRADILDAIDYTLRKNSCNSLSSKKIIFVGDMEQLPPVVKPEQIPLFEQNKYTGYTFKDSFFLQNKHLKVIELEKIHRQIDIEFIENLNIIRDGGKAPYFRKFFTSEINGIILTPHLNTAKYHNSKMLNEINETQYEYISESKCDEGYNISVDDFNIERELVLKSGAKIMYLVNEPERKLFNGSIGTLSIEKDGKELYFINDSNEKMFINLYVFEKKIYVVERDELKLKTVGEIYQYPIKLAYAITIHKSQGLTFDNVTIDLMKECFLKGQLYTALSRVRTPEGLNILR